jgi:methylated-DNA-[protein]-cysteine S-methyltransferase
MRSGNDRPPFPHGFELVATPFGVMGIVWWETAHGPRVAQTFLSRRGVPTDRVVRAVFPTARAATCPAIASLGRELQRFLTGKPVAFNLTRIALERCGEFQRRVLAAEYAIPRGHVSTYGRIAAHLGRPGGARAVGRALARNPFPIVIPCHRAVRTDGGLGGYQGGIPMKRALLEMEGVVFTETGRVRMDRVHY